MSQQSGDAEKPPERLPIVRTLVSSRKILRIQVEKNKTIRTLALERMKGDKWRDQTSHSWMLDGNELVAAR